MPHGHFDCMLLLVSCFLLLAACSFWLRESSTHPLFGSVYGVFLSLEGIIFNPLATSLVSYFFFKQTSTAKNKSYTQKFSFQGKPVNSSTTNRSQMYYPQSPPISPQPSHTYILNTMPSHHRSSHHTSCKAKHLLLRDIRPLPHTSSQGLLRKADLCPRTCIYCDIWKLALLVYSRQIRTPTSPTSPRTPPNSPYNYYYSSSPSSSTSSSSSSSSSSTHNTYTSALKTIESNYVHQRARLNSILSICTADGAEESEGLRIAHDRCLTTVLDLVRQERALRRQWREEEEEEERERERERQWEVSRERQRREREREVREWLDRESASASAKDCGFGARRRAAEQEDMFRRRGSSVVSCAM
jgi:hypothetical protein